MILQFTTLECVLQASIILLGLVWLRSLCDGNAIGTVAISIRVCFITIR